MTEQDILILIYQERLKQFADKIDAYSKQIADEIDAYSKRFKVELELAKPELPRPPLPSLQKPTIRIKLPDMLVPCSVRL